jgi:hypothetical protein
MKNESLVRQKHVKKKIYIPEQTKEIVGLIWHLKFFCIHISHADIG